jgi:hypothetical protein
MSNIGGEIKRNRRPSTCTEYSRQCAARYGAKTMKKNEIKTRFASREACTALDHQTAIRQYAAMPERLTTLPLSFAWRWRRIKQRLHRG